MARRPLTQALLDEAGLTALAGRLFERSALDATRRPSRFSLVVARQLGDAVGLRPVKARQAPADLRHRGLFGLRWRGGYRLVGDPVVLEREAVRPFADQSGQLPATGAPARLDLYAFAPDPGARGLEHRDVCIAGPLGPCPAWLVPGSRDTWVVAVHGKGASRRETLRALPAYARAGLPVLAVSYRNDPEAPPSPDRRYGYGAEWPDIEAAVAFATAQGARRVILAGYSMGGAVCLAFLRSSSLAGLVSGLVLDSPMLDMRATIAFGASRVGIPGRWVPHFLESFRTRYGVNWEDRTYYEDLERFQGPVLLFHGAADTLVPPATTERAAEMLGRRATYLRSEATEHARSWNADPARYEEALEGFVAELV